MRLFLFQIPFQALLINKAFTPSLLRPIASNTFSFQPKSFSSMSETITNFHQLNAKSSKKEDVDFATFKDKVVLVVNVASKCGFTPQYKGLEALYQEFKDKNFVILGFPCNQFGSQEPGTNEEIQSFCSLNYGVTFPIMEKVEVNGDNVHPVYQFLKNSKAGILGLTRIKWNFEKFLVNKKGEVVKRYSSVTTPEAIKSDIENELKQN